jgi:Flp pilus assembly protein TadB
MMIALDGIKSPSPSVRLKSRQRDSKKVWALLVRGRGCDLIWPALPDTVVTLISEFSGTALIQLFAHASTQTAYYDSLLQRETK